VQQTIINSRRDSLSSYLKKIWANRSLITTLAKRDLKAKYAQTGLGLLWTILQPITGLIIYTFFFHFILKFETEDPYILFVLTGLIGWNLFVSIFTCLAFGFC
jgi:ABC-type polysaccharide/polyol phosphate export permease